MNKDIIYIYIYIYIYILSIVCESVTKELLFLEISIPNANHAYE